MEPSVQEVRAALSTNIQTPHPPEQAGLRELNAHLSDESITRMVSVSMVAKSHPLGRLLRAAVSQVGNPPWRELRNLASAINAIHRAGHTEWLARTLVRAQADDVADASSALGEIRCFGVLRECRLAAEPVPEGRTKTPDFSVLESAGGPEALVVEVNTKQMNEREMKRLLDARREMMAFVPPEPGVYTQSTSVTPLGTPRKGENTTQNVAHKIVQVKAESLQHRPGLPFILWVDMQDEDMFGAGNQVVPLQSHRGLLYSGGLWLAAYGRCGDPIFEGAPAEDTSLFHVVMNFPGRFEQDPKISAFCFAFADAIVVFENPTATHPLPPFLAPALARHRHFSWAESWLAWPLDRNALQNRIDTARAVSTTLRLSEEVRAEIERAAYELYERRGRTHGHDIADWLQAESAMRG